MKQITTNIGPSVFYSYLLEKINKKLKNWNLKLVKGRGFNHNPTSNGKYGHVELEIYQSKDNWNSIIWEVDEEKLPNEFRLTIQECLSFFVTYLQGIRGERLNLTFRITNGSFHEVDSVNIGYQKATVLALLKCFENN